MKAYRVHLRSEGGNSAGYVYTGSLREARKVKRAHDADAPTEFDLAEITPVSWTPTRKGTISALNRFGGHADNG